MSLRRRYYIYFRTNEEYGCDLGVKDARLDKRKQEQAGQFDALIHRGGK